MTYRSNDNNPTTIFWFRRDLRLHDNTGLIAALKAAGESGGAVTPLFIFDTAILDRLEDRDDARVGFIHASLEELDRQLKDHGSGLNVFHGKPLDVFKEILKDHAINAVFTNHDYEPYAIERDNEVGKLLASQDIQFETFKDQVVFEKRDVVKGDGTPYTVYTPYSKRWKAVLKEKPVIVQSLPSHPQLAKAWPAQRLPTLEQLGFKPSSIDIPSAKLSTEITKNYDKTRDIPAIAGTTRMGLHLRFGTVSVRELVQQALKLNETYLGELIWREFFSQIMFHFPHVVKETFKPKYATIKWRHNKAEFQRWCDGQTGSPIVDAGMRELNSTGFMHNRVRMIAASYLIKNLLIEPKWGEFYFARRLLDYDLASNNGNWQWVAGTGCDAAPYFRIFNPELQTKRFDPKHDYIETWVPEYKESAYPAPAVTQEEARERTLAAYKAAFAEYKA